MIHIISSYVYYWIDWWYNINTPLLLTAIKYYIIPIDISLLHEYAFKQAFSMKQNSVYLQNGSIAITE